MSEQSDPHCEFCEGPATWIAVPQCQPQYGCRLSCDRHRHWVRRLITLDIGSGVVFRRRSRCLEGRGKSMKDGKTPEANNERAVTWYSQGPDGELDLHASSDDARAAAESTLEYYSDIAASDGEWNADIGNLEWGRLVPHEVANIHEIPAPEGFPDGEYWDVTLVPYQPKKG